MSWLATVPRYRKGHDPQVDASDGPNARRNDRMIVTLLDSFNESHTYGALRGEEILAVNAAFYRYEMMNVAPPRSLAVDCTLETEFHELRATIICEASDFVVHRAVFSFDYCTDGVQQLLDAYDAALAHLQECDVSRAADLPRDTFSCMKTMWKSDKLGVVGRWRTPLKGGLSTTLARRQPYRSSGLEKR